jgi:hypothetical protein
MSAASPPDVWIHVPHHCRHGAGAGLTRFVQHPGRDRIDPVHFGWTLFVLSAIVHFWWYEFGLFNITTWTFELYFFVLLASSLFPDKMGEYASFGDYFQSRRRCSTAC